MKPDWIDVLQRALPACGSRPQTALRIQYAFRELLEDQAGLKNNPQKVTQSRLGKGVLLMRPVRVDFVSTF